jgi:hypothetical protein
MPLVGFEPTISVFERAKTFHAIDRAVPVIGSKNSWANTFFKYIRRFYLPKSYKRMSKNKSSSHRLFL